MSAASDNIALMATMALPERSGSAVPEWVHLLPRGERIETWDGRGPFRYASGADLIRTSMSGGHARIVIDENHSTDLAAKVGMSAPARGYVVEMEEREDGIWGRVDWTETGKALMSDRAYWGLSPVFRRDKAGRVTAILRAALTNDPNLRGLAVLNHQEDGDMPLLERLAEILGCEAGDDAVVGAITELHARAGENGDEALTELQSQVAEIGTALGVDGAAPVADILAAARAAHSGGPDRDAVVELQTQLAEVTTELNTLRDSQARDRAESFVDGAIKAGRVGVKPLRDHYVERHMKDPASVEREVGAMPILGGSGRIVEQARPGGEGEISLNAQQREIARMMGVSEEDYLAQLKAQHKNEEAG